MSRFQAQADPRAAIERYLHGVHAQSLARGYRFDATKLHPIGNAASIQATVGQLAYEWQHLLGKLQARSPTVFAQWREVAMPEPNPMFALVPGPIEPWERP